MDEETKLFISHLALKLQQATARMDELEEKIRILYMSDGELAEHVRGIEARKAKDKATELLEGMTWPAEMPKGVN